MWRIPATDHTDLCSHSPETGALTGTARGGRMLRDGRMLRNRRMLRVGRMLRNRRMLRVGRMLRNRRMLRVGRMLRPTPVDLRR
ncbi:hypothetical protein GCM10009758_01360 [Microbacterium hatanonis]